MTVRRDGEMMRECLRLAARGRGSVSPNPMVGSVIVKGSRIVGRGFHRRFGGPHAEVAAIRAAGGKAAGATLYVNLEPCSHTGKTPPCADLIIASRIREVVVGMEDPNPLVSGRGIRKLRRAGIRVRTGVLAGECSLLNAGYLRHVATGLPLVTLKVAQSLDGVIADSTGASRWITGEEARRDVHRRRSEADCVLVGARTVAQDDPLLTVRLVRGPQPVRAVLDGRFSAPAGARIFRGAKRRPVILITSDRAFVRRRRKAAALARQGVGFIVFRAGRDGRIPPADVLASLGARGITSLLVEGGPETWGAFLNARAADRIVLYTSPTLLGGDRRAFAPLRPSPLDRRVRLADASVRLIGVDLVLEGDLRHPLGAS